MTIITILGGNLALHGWKLAGRRDGKDFQQHLRAKGKNLFEVTLHKECVDQPASKKIVIHFVAADRARAIFNERVNVMPLSVRTAKLFVGKADGRFPTANS